MGFLDHLLSRRTYETMFGPVNVIVMPDACGRRVRIMELAGTFQSASYEGDRWAELAFEYYKGFDALFTAQDQGQAMNRVLMMGAGAFAWPKHALTTHPDLALDVVEIDPEIVRIARKHFYVDRLERFLSHEGETHRLNIIIDDAFHFLTTTSTSYDAIINDVFQAEAVPASMMSESLFQAVKEHLTPGGVYAQNLIVDLSREGAYRLFTQMSDLNKTFKHVCAIDATDEEFGGADNYIILASDVAYPFEGKIDYTF